MQVTMEYWAAERDSFKDALEEQWQAETVPSQQVAGHDSNQYVTGGM